MHLSPDWIIGFVGDRGSSKSLGSGNVGIRDFAMSGADVWSNSKLKLTVIVSDQEAAPYGARGGMVVYESKDLDRQALNELDSRYENSVLVIEEINLFGTDSWRAMSNESLSRSDLVQQLRKFQCGLVFNCIDEGFVINRVRDATDVFIKCADVASHDYNLVKKKLQGHDFEWTIYPMSWRFAGAENSYKQTNKPLMTVPINLRKLWGIIDTNDRQQRKFTKELMPMELTESPEITAARAKWGWLQDKVLAWKKRGIQSIESGELPLLVGCPITDNIKKWLGAFGVSWDAQDQSWCINTFSLSDSSLSVGAVT